MKKLVLLTFCLFQVVATVAQDEKVQRGNYMLGVQYHQEFVLDGYVKVRE